MKKLLLVGGLFLSLLFICTKAEASHCAGGEIQYQWISDSTYHIIFKLYRDCRGNTAPNNVSLCYQSTCDNVAHSAIMQPLATLPDGTPNGSSVSTGCSGFPNACQSASSTLPGYAEWWYATDVTLPFQCNHWTFSVSISARNTSANLTGNSNNLFYVEATINNVAAQGNSSPVFTVKPVPFVCINSPYTYNNGTNDPDGDSLHYSIISPEKGDCNSSVVPIPFSSTIYNTTNNPIATNNTFVLDPITGQLSFVPGAISASTLTLLVEEYRNHVLIGHTMRDIQVQTLNCNSVQPAITIDTPSLAGAPLINGHIETCANTPLHFCFKVTSPNTSAILVASDNHVAVAPGSVINYVGQTTDSLVGCFTWTPTAADTGLKIFTVIVKDSTCTAGIVISQSFVLPIYIYPVTNIFKDTTICAGNSVQLQATGGNNFVWTVLPGGSPLSTLSCTTCSNPVATPLITTSYVVTSTLISVCNKNKDTVTIVVFQPPAPLPTSNTPVCRGNSINLSAGTTALNYQWTGPAGFTSTLQNPVIANAQGPNSGVYQLIASNGICASAPATVSVLVNPAPSTPVVTGNSPVCEGQAVVLTALSTGAVINYFWSGPNGFTATTGTVNIPGATTQLAGTYTVQAGYPGNACLSASTSYSVSVKPKAVADFRLSRNPVCSDDTVTVTYTGTGLVPDSVRWDFAGGVVGSGAGTGPYVVAYPESGQQTITLIANANGCIDSIKKELTVQQAPSSAFHVNPEACLGEHLAVDAANSVGTDLQYTWDFGPATVLEGSGRGRYYISYATPGYQVITLQTQSPLCKSVLTADTVFVHPEPAAHILSASRTDICTSDSIRLDAYDQQDYTYHWSPEIFFQGDTSAVTNAHVHYTGYVYLNVADSYGCKSKDSLFIHTTPCCELFFPNAFTPNNDGHNDVFRVITIGHHSISSFRIMNRWGQIVFETADERRAWDGTTSGVPQESGTYFYYIRYQCSNGQYYEQKGDVLLLR